jgi:hypothetical protein
MCHWSVGSGSTASSGSLANVGSGGFLGWCPSRVNADVFWRKVVRAVMPCFVPRRVGSHRSLETSRSLSLACSHQENVIFLI